MNERHEYSRLKKAGGGGLPKFGEINWRSKGRTIQKSLVSARATVELSPDPTKSHRLFMVALPQKEIIKRTDDKRVPDGQRAEMTEYGGEHSKVFRRLGMDLLALVDDGAALVHAPAQRLDQMMTISGALENAGPREQARWATIKSFVPSPMETRIDREWLALMPAVQPVDTIIELQPVLTRGEVEEVVSAILGTLSQEHGSAIRAAGRDFSGRYWYRLPLIRKQVHQLAESFYSIQSLHHPLTTPLAVATPPTKRGGPGPAVQIAVSTPGTASLSLPAVAVVDAGVPSGHVHLERYCRGRYRHPDAPATFEGDHGSHVASRVVFGDFDVQSGTAPAPPASCQFLDVVVPVQLMQMDDKALTTALDAVVGAYPDVRVFNCSFGNLVALRTLSGVERRERLAEVQDLDNLIFARDILVVMAAGNSPSGVVPAQPYPDHLDEETIGRWATGPLGSTRLSVGRRSHASGPVGW
jgi:Subtilase family